MNKANNIIKERILDFSDCEYLREIHKIIQEQLDLPDWYGSKLDALWDALTGIIYVPVIIKIIYKPKNKASENLSHEIGKIIEAFRKAQQEYNEFTLAVDVQLNHNFNNKLY